MRVEGLCVVPMSAIGNAMSPYTAQNLGACRPERIPAGLKAAFRLVFAFALLNCLLLELGSHSLSLFSWAAKDLLPLSRRRKTSSASWAFSSVSSV